MLRRDFLAAIASFTAAGAVAKSALASAGKPTASVAEVCCGRASGAVLPVDVAKALDERSIFERTLIDCLRDGSMRLLGVTTHVRGDYRAVYLPAAPGAVAEQPRHETLMGMYDRGLIVVDEVIVFNGYSGVEVVFSICTR
jgi:hypothetical protein